MLVKIFFFCICCIFLQDSETKMKKISQKGHIFILMANTGQHKNAGLAPQKTSENKFLDSFIGLLMGFLALTNIFVHLNITLDKFLKSRVSHICSFISSLRKANLSFTGMLFLDRIQRVCSIFLRKQDSLRKDMSRL